MTYLTIISIWIWGFFWAISRAYITQIMKNYIENLAKTDFWKWLSILV